jgi:hypothetical protein
MSTNNSSAHKKKYNQPIFNVCKFVFVKRSYTKKKKKKKKEMISSTQQDHQDDIDKTGSTLMQYHGYTKNRDYAHYFYKGNLFTNNAIFTQHFKTKYVKESDTVELRPRIFLTFKHDIDYDVPITDKLQSKKAISLKFELNNYQKLIFDFWTCYKKLKCKDLGLKIIQSLLLQNIPMPIKNNTMDNDETMDNDLVERSHRQQRVITHYLSQ